MSDTSDTSIDDFSDLNSSGKGARKETIKDVRKGSRKNDRDSLSILPIKHLVSHFLLFALLLLFLMSLTRAGYAIWHLDKFDDTQTLLSVFWMGLRFDLALIGLLLAVPVFIVPLFAMSRSTRGLAKFISVTWMIICVIVVLLLELITPYTLQVAGVRPDIAVLSSLGNPLDVMATLWSSQIIPAVIGLILAILILIAFLARLNTHRFLAYPVKVFPAICLAIIGLALCLYAARSSLNPLGLPLTPHSALVSSNSLVNEIALNTPYKSLYGLFIR